MARGRSTFRQRDVTAALKAAHAAGCGVRRLVIDREGRIVIETTDGTTGQPPIEEQRNEWDEAK
ncbi:MAG: hypothetical protein LCH56_05920 [Proteobacteria bacterium]|nr:hypothetical protein [Pseudomonadota bacterium]